MKLRKKALNIEKYDEKAGKIKEILHNNEKSLNYNEIAEKTNIDEREVFKIIGDCFTKETKKTTHSGIATKDFLLFGEKVDAIKNNFYYKVIKARVDLGKKVSYHTRGRLH